ncbi:MAG TPA: hypothetical protein VFS21_14910 [Roseiflexaceae bacterium]|nr:hypothetical protein [Roseiflexaceae bacterium]
MSNRSHPRLTRTIAALLALPLLLAGCMGPPDAALDVQGLPIYPRAAVVQTGPWVEAAPRQWRAVMFETTDTPDTIARFYQEHLVKQGWSYDAQSDTFAFSESCPRYTLHISTVSNSGTSVSVDVRLAKEPCW